MKKRLIIILFLINLPLLSIAVPVEDPTEWAKTIEVIKQLQDQAKQLSQQYEMLKEQYQQMSATANNTQRLYQDAEGHSGFGNLLNGDSDLKNREWSPATWDQALQGLSGGNPDRYHQLLTEYQNNHPTLDETNYEKGGSQQQYQLYQQQVTTNQAAATNATYAFNEIKQHLDNIHQISEQIEQANTTKASLDLNSRLLTEIAYINVQELKMQALVNQQMAEEGAEKVAGETMEAKFNALPNQ